jgi:peptidoglycan/xylan/chitin deacetylase (PgdA/CDA1 family)
LVPNPGLEAADAATPTSWFASGWGDNTATYDYLNTGHAGAHSVTVTVSDYSTGDANWGYAPHAISPGNYEFTDWYQSNVSTEIDAGVAMQDGSTQYFYVTKVGPTEGNTWNQAEGVLQIPQGAVSATFFHLIAANGYLTTDDYAVTPYTPAPFTRGLVSVTFDDGWQNQFTNGLPVMQKYGLHATYYIISGSINDTPDYMTVAEIQSLKNAGMEIGSHTVTHPDLTTLSSTQLTNELKNSQTTLVSDFGGPITDFAYPYGAYTSATQAAAAQYYQTQRSVESGYNTADLTNLQDLKVQNVFNTTTPAQVQAWINQAAADRSWLILVYHVIAVSPADPTDTQYTTQPPDLDAEMAEVKNSGLGVVTVNRAVNEITPQLIH